jgi:hypothetical protein
LDIYQKISDGKEFKDFLNSKTGTSFNLKSYLK